MHADLRQLLTRPIAHRGLHACGGPGAVENSISAAMAAVAAGYGIECDVQLSRDGEAIVFHDEALGRLTGAIGQLADLDAGSLGRLKLCGGPDHVPTLTELLTVIDGRVPLVIELKSSGDGDPRLADRTLALLEDYGGPVALESFDAGLVLHCVGQRPPRPIGLIGPPESGRNPAPTVFSVCDFLSWQIEDLARVAMCHPSLPRTTWTVRTAAQADVALGLQTQIVFEGFTPFADIKDASKKGGGGTR